LDGRIRIMFSELMALLSEHTKEADASCAQIACAIESLAPENSTALMLK
jgi:hypothetical protein